MSGKNGSGSGGGEGPRDSIADDLNAAWDEAERDGGGDASGGNAEGADARGAGASGGETGGDRVEQKTNIDAGADSGDKKDGSGERQRDEHGRFAKQDDKGATDPKAASPEKATAADPKASEGQPKAQQPDAAESLPSNWSDVSADDWGKVPASVRAKITAREAQVAQGFQAYNQGLATVAQMSKSRGISWQDGLKRLTDAQALLDANPHQAFISIAKSYGLNLDDLAEMAAGTMPLPGQSGQNGNGNGHAVDPQLTSRLDRIEQHIQTTAMSPLLQEIQAFGKTVDFFDELIPQINAMIPAAAQSNPGSDRQTILRAAYSAAVAVRPDIQAKIKQKAEATARQEAEARAAKERANRGGNAASVHLSGQPGGSARTVGQDSVGSVADDLLATWNELSQM